MEDAQRPMTCEDAVRQFFAYLDRALSGEPMEATLEAHLGACLDCCDRLDFARKLDALMKDRLGEAPLPAGVEDRIRRLVFG